MVKKVSRVDTGSIRVFVYGTLKKHKCNNIVIKNAGGKFLGMDSITVENAMFVDLSHFPALLYPLLPKDNYTETVRGQIFYGGQNMLKSLDIMEGYPSFFNRLKVTTNMLGRKCWVYHLSESWFDESADIISNHIWEPEGHEKIFWQSFDKVSKKDNK